MNYLKKHFFIGFETISGMYPDGASYNLKSLILYTKNLSFGYFDRNIMFSLRVPPQMFADGLVQGNALSSEWKTAPLWGLGLVQTVNPKTVFCMMREPEQ